MTIGAYSKSDSLSFVDPSIGPEVLWRIPKLFGDATTYWAIIKTIFEAYRRFPSVEYAAGFDGVDDYILVPDVLSDKTSIEIHLNLWISDVDRKQILCDLVDSSDNKVVSLASLDSEPSGVQVLRHSEDGVQIEGIPQIEEETWCDLLIWSDGKVISLKVDGEHVRTISDIPIKEPPLSLYLGTTAHQTQFFEGMLKKLTVTNESSTKLALDSTGSISFETQDSAIEVRGIHSLRKGRFRKTFVSHR